MLKLVRPHIQNGIFFTSGVGHVQGRGFTHFGYIEGRDQQVEHATAEAWQWAERQGLLLPAEGMNGANGFKRLSRDGAKIADGDIDLARYRALAEFPKSLLHPMFADKVHAALLRGDLERDNAAHLSQVGSGQAARWKFHDSDGEVRKNLQC